MGKSVQRGFSKAFILIIFAITTILIVGCQKKIAETDNEISNEFIEIIMWSTVTNDEEVKVLESLCTDWGTTTGHTVKIVKDESEDIFTSFMQAAGTNNGPDINFGTPNDVLGLFNEAGLLAEVPEGVIKDNDFVDVAIDAVTLDGKKYAIPWSLETISLYYNVDLVDVPPTDWETFVDQAKEVGFSLQAPRLYFSYPIFSATGGYIFKSENGTYDTSDIGLGENSRKGYELVHSLYNEYELMPTDVDFNIAKMSFQNGTDGLYIGGIWDAISFEENGINFKIATLPSIDGVPMKPWTGVKTAIVSSKSKVQSEAWDLLAYISANSSVELFEAGKKLPVLKSAQNEQLIKNDDIAIAFLEQAKYSEAMPNIPEMNAVWMPCFNNITALINNQITVDEAVENVPKQIEETIETMN